MTNQTKRKSFILHKDSLDILDKLTDEQAGKLFKAIKFYQKHNKIPKLDLTLDLVFTPFLSQFIRDDENYKNTCEARKLAGSKGGKQKVANASKSKQKVANVADSKSKSKSKSKNEIKNESEIKNEFTPPTLQQVKDYYIEKGYQDSPNTFFDYYDASNWKDKDGEQVKNWKQKAISWHGRSKDKSDLLPKNIIKLNKVVGDVAIKAIKDYGQDIDLICFEGKSKIVKELSPDKKKEIKSFLENKNITIV
jgi:hypothetical protein